MRHLAHSPRASLLPFTGQSSDVSLCTTCGWSDNFPFTAIFFNADYLIGLFLFIVIYCQLCFSCSEAVMYDIKACFPLPPGSCLSTVFTHCCCFNNRFLLSNLEDVWLKKKSSSQDPQWNAEILLEKPNLLLMFHLKGMVKVWKRLYLLSAPSLCTE